MKNKLMAIRHNENLNYPTEVPYDPSERYLELGTGNFVIGKQSNKVYDAIRNCLLDLEMDKDNIGTEKWSPFSDIITPGNTVVIKPNLVRHTDEEYLQECVTTHPAVIRPIIDYCWRALKENGKIIVGDAPSTETDFNLLSQRYGLNEMIETLKRRGVDVELIDFRGEKTIMQNGIWVDEQIIEEAPESQIVNLGQESYFAIPQYRNAKFHGGGYEIHTTTKHHNGNCQEYSVSKVILNADVIISIPKLKTHKKAGITCCMKNLVGINTNKNYLPHWVQGSKNQGGDEMPSLSLSKTFNLSCINFFKENIQEHYWKKIDKFILKTAKFVKNFKEGKHDQKEDRTDYAAWLMKFLIGQPIFGGAWKGNETICRMILDLNKIFLQCDKNGKLCDKTDRKIFYIVDGITMGQRNGPMLPEPLKTHIVAAGYNGLQLDTAIITLLNIDPEMIPLYKMAWQAGEWLCGEQNQIKLFNGKEIKDHQRLPYNVILPDNWNKE